MNRTPWSLWNLESGEPADGADTDEAREVLEGAMARIAHCGEPRHPGILHMYIHLMEMSPFPELALRAADQLRGIAPHSGHLQHMATHIDVLCGDYLNVVNWNERAIQADRPYVEARGPFNFYTMYRAHNYHFKIYGAMFLGQFGPAIETARAMQAEIPERAAAHGDAQHGRLAGGVRAHRSARAGPLRQVGGDPRTGTARGS